MPGGKLVPVVGVVALVRHLASQDTAGVVIVCEKHNVDAVVSDNVKKRLVIMLFFILSSPLT